VTFRGKLLWSKLAGNGFPDPGASAKILADVHAMIDASEK
jgi:hypothetical protein